MTIEALIDVKDFLPNDITPEQNGIITADRMRKIYCGGMLYADAARSWRAMVRAAALDDIFLSVNQASGAYRDIIRQRKMFAERFVEVKEPSSDDAICVEFEGKLLQLKTGAEYVEIPGQSSHGFGLAIRIGNIDEKEVAEWLDRNAEQFGFVREYDFMPSRFVYIKSREPIPERVLEIETIPAKPKFSAGQITRVVDCQWLNPPSNKWRCNGLFASKPFRTGALAVLDQGEGVGISSKSIGKIFRQCAGFICTRPDENIIKRGRPILLTSNINDTLEKLTAFFKTEPPETIEPAETSPVVDIKALQAQLNFCQKANPETVIFQRKKQLSERLMKISLEEFQNAAEQPWYDEYLALLTIRLQEPSFRFLGKKYCEELLRKYVAQSDGDEREIFVWCMLQFMEPTELTIPFNQQLYSKEMLADIHGVFLHHFTKLGYSDEDISRYWLAQQLKRTHSKRKMRVAFIVITRNKYDKILPIYRAMREREDTEAFLVLCPHSNYNHGRGFWKFFHDQFPDDTIYDANSLMDLRKLKPDYVFYQTPYEEVCPFPGFSSKDVVRFAKICHIAYGASLAHIFLDRLLAASAKFYRNVYMLFCSAETVKEKFTAKFSESAEMGYQHFEFLGYPALENVDGTAIAPHSTKRILWTPRWSYDARIGGSHFLEYKDKFIELHERYGDKVELSMRPHMNTFRELQSKGLMSKEEVEAYKRRLKKNDVGLHSTFIDLEEEFSDKDILLTDYSTIIVVYFLTGRPIIYCDFPNAVMLPEYQEMLECMYVARSWEDVERYLDDLVNGIDPLFERRQKAVAKIRAANANATERIIERLLQDFKACLEEPSHCDTHTRDVQNR